MMARSYGAGDLKLQGLGKGGIVPVNGLATLRRIRPLHGVGGLAPFDDVDVQGARQEGAVHPNKKRAPEMISGALDFIRGSEERT